jgi:NADP-dependent 3-hydroxy acid dehydrogenase YdfG
LPRRTQWAALILGARRTDRLDELAKNIRGQGGRAVACTTDVTRRQDLERLVAQAVAEFGRLDVLVSNAGISKIAP